MTLVSGELFNDILSAEFSVSREATIFPHVR